MVSNASPYDALQVPQGRHQHQEGTRVLHRGPVAQVLAADADGPRQDAVTGRVAAHHAHRAPGRRVTAGVEPALVTPLDQSLMLRV